MQEFNRIQKDPRATESESVFEQAPQADIRV